MTVLSLVKMILEVGGSVSTEDKKSNDIVQEGVLAFKQARDLMDFADCADNVHVNAESFNTSNMEAFLLRYKAEKDFRTLKRMYRHWKLGRELNREDDSVVEALNKCAPKLFECSACVTSLVKKSLYSRNLTANSNDPPCKSIYSASLHYFQRLENHVNLGRACWEDVAPAYYLFQVSQFIMEKKIENPEPLLDSLRTYLTNVVYNSLSDLPGRILESCNKWAEDFEEEKISKAIDIAGRAWAVMDKVTNPTKESTTFANAAVQTYPAEIESTV